MNETAFATLCIVIYALYTSGSLCSFQFVVASIWVSSFVYGLHSPSTLYIIFIFHFVSWFELFSYKVSFHKHWRRDPDCGGSVCDELSLQIGCWWFRITVPFDVWFCILFVCWYLTAPTIDCFLALSLCPSIYILTMRINRVWSTFRMEQCATFLLIFNFFSLPPFFRIEQQHPLFLCLFVGRPSSWILLRNIWRILCSFLAFRFCCCCLGLFIPRHDLRGTPISIWSIVVERAFIDNKRASDLLPILIQVTLVEPKMKLILQH